LDGFSTGIRIETVRTQQMMAVAEHIAHLPLILMAQHRTPLAFTLYHVFSHFPGLALSHDDDIGLITGTKITSL
jgi:hypothetical protein